MTWTIHTGDCRTVMADIPDASIDCIVTSPPYWGLRDYGNDAQIGLEKTPDEYVREMVAVFSDARRILKQDGTLWLNLGDSYATGAGQGNRTKRDLLGTSWRPNRLKIEGLKPKDLVGIPWRVAFALQADGWWLRQDIIWHKPNPMPESVTDRCTKSHEYIFLFTKAERYYFDAKAIAEASVYSGPPRKKDSFKRNVPVPPGQTPQHRANRDDICYSGTRNKRTVWTVPTSPCKEAHFAIYPPNLIRDCIKAGCRPGGVVLDPFIGSGTTGIVCMEESRNIIGIELNPEYAEIARRRIAAAAMLPKQEELAI